MKLRFNSVFCFFYTSWQKQCVERTVEEFKVLNRFLLTSRCLFAKNLGHCWNPLQLLWIQLSEGAGCKLLRAAFSSLQVVISKTWENSKNSKNYWTFCLFHSKPGGLADSKRKIGGGEKNRQERSSSLTGATDALVEGFQGMRWILRLHPWAPFSALHSTLHLYSDVFTHFTNFSVGKKMLVFTLSIYFVFLAGECVCICTRMLSVRACARPLCAFVFFVFFCRGQRASN